MRPVATSPPGAQRLALHVLLLLATLAAAQVLPREASWDQINHHFYLGAFADGSRLGIDYFPVGPQSYQVPYAFAPFAAMVLADWPPRLVVAVLALSAGLSLCLVAETGLLVARSLALPWLPTALAAVVLAAAAPVFLVQVGSSSADLPSALPALAGWVVLLHAAAASLRAPLSLGKLTATALAAGLLMGAAAGLKLSNGMSIVAAPLLLLAVRASWPARAAAAVALGAGIAGALVAVVLPWSLAREAHLGDPRFPSDAALFCPADQGCAPPAPGARWGDPRFLPASFGEAVRMPVRMVLPHSAVHTETSAPDLRFVAALLLLPLAAAIAARRRERAARPWLVLGLAYLATLASWLYLSGNSRYLLPWVLLLGPLCVALVALAGRGGWRLPVYGTAALIAGQLVQTIVAADLRLGTARWGERWFELDVPPLLRQPALVVLAARPAPGMLPAQALGSAYVNIGSLPALSPDTPAGQHIAQRIAAWRGPVLGIGNMKDNKASGAGTITEGVLALHTGRFGLGVDEARCEQLALRGLRREAGGAATETMTLRWSVCPLRPDEGLRRRIDAEQDRLRPAFLWLEERCPNLFPALDRAGTIELSPLGASRSYPTDLDIVVIGERLMYADRLHGGDPVEIGPLDRPDEWKVDCSVRALPAFGGIATPRAR